MSLIREFFRLLLCPHGKSKRRSFISLVVNNQTKASIFCVEDTLYSTHAVIVSRLMRKPAILLLRTRRMTFSLILFLMLLSRTQASQSCIRMGHPGTQFFPTDESIVLLGTVLLPSYQACLYTCHLNDLCRVFDYDSRSQQCRLFEGDLQTTGLIGPSNSSTSTAGDLEQLPFLFATYGQPCGACSQSRYLRCINATCACQEHTYWTSNVCASQSLYAGACTTADQCRSELNHTCLQFFQCGRKLSFPFFRGRIDQ